MERERAGKRERKRERVGEKIDRPSPLAVCALAELPKQDAALRSLWRD